MPDKQALSGIIQLSMYEENIRPPVPVKHCQLVTQSPLIREGFLLPAGDVENKVEQLPAHLFNGLFAGSDSARC